MPITATAKPRYKPYLNLSDLGSKRKSVSKNGHTAAPVSASWTQRKGDGLNALFSRLSQHPANMVVNRGRTLKGSSYNENAARRPRSTHRKAVTSVENHAQPLEPYAISGVDDSGVGIHWSHINDNGENKGRFVEAGGEFGSDGEQRGFSESYKKEGRSNMHWVREDSGQENGEEVPDWLRKALTGSSSSAATTFRPDIAHQVLLSSASMYNNTGIEDATSPAFYQHPVTNRIAAQHAAFIQSKRLDRMDHGPDDFGEESPPTYNNYPEQMTVGLLSPSSFDLRSVAAKPFTTPRPHVVIHRRSSQSDIGNHNRFSQMALQPENHTFGYGASPHVHSQAQARSWAPETPVKPFSTPFLQSDADLSLEDRYADTRKTEFVVDPRMNMPAIAEEVEEEEYTIPGVGIMQGIYSSNAPVVEYHYAEETTSGAHTVQDGYPHGGPLLRTNTSGGNDEHIGAESYPYYHDDRTKDGFDGHDADVEHPESTAMITEPLSGCYSEISLDGFTGQMSEQPVFDSSGPSWTAGSSSQTNLVAEEFDRYHTVPSHRETLPQPTPVTPSDDGKVTYYVDAGQDTKGPCSNVTLDVDILEAAAAENIRRQEGLTQVFHVSANMASVMNADKAVLKVVPSSAEGQLMPDSFSTSIMNIGEKVQANILELRKHRQSWEGSVHVDLEMQRKSQKHLSESIASFSDSDDEANTEHFTGASHHGRDLSTENSDESETHTQYENGGPRVDVDGQGLKHDIEEAHKEMDFDSACTFVDQGADPGFEVWVDEECKADST